MSSKLSTLRSRIIRAGAATLLLAAPVCLQAQSSQPEPDKSGKTVVSITNLNGRVIVLASDNQKSVSVAATRNGVPVTSNEVQTTVKGGNVDVEVHSRRESDRIDVTVRVPSRSRIR